MYCLGQARPSVEVVYASTSVGPARADARTLLGYVRGHWGIENKVHFVRDVPFDEDRSQVRTGAAPQVMAAIRKLVLALLRRAGHPNIAAALRTDAGRPADALGCPGSRPRRPPKVMKSPWEPKGCTCRAKLDARTMPVRRSDPGASVATASSLMVNEERAERCQAGVGSLCSR